MRKLSFNISGLLRLLLLSIMWGTASENGLYAQTTSLKDQLSAATHDSTRLRLYLAIASQQTNVNLDTTFFYCDKAEELARSTDNSKGIADAQYERAYAVFYSGKPEIAEVMYIKLIEEYRSLGDSSRIAACYNKLGFVYRERGDKAKALQHYNLALRSNSGEADKSEAGNSYLNIGLIYHDQENYQQALKYELLGLSMYQEAKEHNRTANALIRIGNIYMDMKEDSTSLNYLQQALALSTELGNQRLIAICLNNMAMIYSGKGELARAIGMYKQALVIRESIGDKNGVAILLNNIGEIYSQRDMTDSALYFVNKSLQMTLDLGYKDMQGTNYLSLSAIHYNDGDYLQAYEYYKKYHAVYKEMNNEESSQQINELNAKLDTERKQRQIDLLSNEAALKEAALQQERAKGWLLGLGLVAVIAIAALIWNSNRKTKRTNVILETQKSEIAEQKKIVEEQHRDIVDSINYALRIQHAVMPSRDELKRLFPESFLISKPRDIVSGDFWWISEKDGLKILVVADCTGHGVPGAFMSLIGTSLLNEIVNERNITDPGLVLDMLSEKVVQVLHQHENRATAKDGMDIAVAVIDENKEQLHFAGANNSLYYTVIDNSLHELKGDRQPIGYYTEKHKPFSVCTVPMQDITNIWLFTDGYADQFCGHEGNQLGKKYKYSRLKSTLVKIQGLNPAQQRDYLAKEFEDWKGNMFQVDDVMVAGIRYY